MAHRVPKFLAALRCNAALSIRRLNQVRQAQPNRWERLTIAAFPVRRRYLNFARSRICQNNRPSGRHDDVRAAWSLGPRLVANMLPNPGGPRHGPHSTSRRASWHYGSTELQPGNRQIAARIAKVLRGVTRRLEQLSVKTRAVKEQVVGSAAKIPDIKNALEIEPTTSATST